MRSIQITNDVVHAIKEAGTIGETYISLGFTNNNLIVAVQSIRGYISVCPCMVTNHPKFLIRVDKFLLLEVLVNGFITVEQVNSKEIKLTTYKDAECLDLVSSIKFASSYSDDVKSLMDVVDKDLLEEINIQKNLLTTEVRDLLAQTGKPLNFTEDYYYSVGNGINFYIPVQEKTEKVPFDLVTLNLLSKSIRESPLMFINKSKKTNVYQRFNTYFTWRNEYNRTMDTSVVFNVKPIAEFDLAIPVEMPMTSNRRYTKAKEIIYTELDVVGQKYTNKSVDYVLEGQIKVSNRQGVEISAIVINTSYVRYLTSFSTLHIEVFPKFIRIQREFMTLDIACSVILQ